jgi:cold shock CspA family protein
MIDSGAGGADVIFHSKAVDELGLSDLLDSEGRRVSSRVRGGSGANGESGGATLTYRTTMEWLQLFSADAKGECVRFENIDTLLASGEGFSLSEHSCGMICARLLGKKTIVYDVPRRRIAFIE